MNNVSLRLLSILLFYLIITGCFADHTSGKVVAKNNTKTAWLQLILPELPSNNSDLKSAFLKIRLDPSYIRSLDKTYNLEYPVDSCIRFIGNDNVSFPSFIQYINSGKSDEFHYLVGISGLDNSKVVMNTRFGITAIDTLFTPINF